jgi:hypothetical protein
MRSLTQKGKQQMIRITHSANSRAPQRNFVLELCHMCFAMMAAGAFIVAAVLPLLYPPATMAFRIAIVVVGFVLWLMAEGWLALLFSAKTGGGSFISISIVVGVVLMLAAWALALHVI